MARQPPRRRLPPLNAIRAFEAAARHASLKAAATELGVTQGAVSRQVRLLEEWLGGPALFRRLGRGVTPTPGAEALLAEFGPALDRIAAAVRRHAERHGEPARTVLRVNATATFSLRWLLPRLPLFRGEHPGIEVRLSTSNDPVDALPEEFDVVIRGGPDSFHGFVAHPLVGERRLPVCSPALLARGALETVPDLERHTLLHVSSLPRLWRDWLAAAGHPGLQPAAALTLDHFFLSVQGRHRRPGHRDGTHHAGRRRPRGGAAGGAVPRDQPAGALLLRLPAAARAARPGGHHLLHLACRDRPVARHAVALTAGPARRSDPRPGHGCCIAAA